MSYRYWLPIGRLHVPAPMSDEQAMAAEHLRRDAFERNAIVDYQSGIKHEKKR